VLSAAPEDADGLTDGLATLLSDRDVHADLARRGPVRAKRFSWNEAARVALSAFRRIL
jgi:hypothetical protein